ncbi:MAG: hypothetical protein P4L35_10680 [Ignavibacteriaceae bacterium]|nr:hypothetical protein [Ignavibacteriaceae bacterium]
MNSKIEITELDLFTFVLFRNELSKEKKEFIESNIELFADQIEIIKQSQIPLNDELKEEAISKCRLPLEKKEILVFPLNYEITVPSEATLTLAAKSADIDIHPLTRTFIDEGKSVLLKLINEKGITKVFLFDSEGRSMEKYIITTYPSDIVISSNNDNPILNLNLAEIEKISVII